MNYPSVSIIIPTYNKSELLFRAIKSVLNQTFKDFELIIVDDGSTDDTKSVVEGFLKEDKRIKYIWQENFGGPSRPLNKGIEIANGEYIAILEDDDEWLPEKLEKQIEVLENYQNVGLVSCSAFVIKNEKLLKIYNPPYKGILKKENYELFWLNWGIISLSTVLMRKKLLLDIGKFDENLKSCQDVDFYMRAIKNTDFYFLTEPLVKYYIYESSLSRKNFWIKWIPENEYILKKYEKEFEESPKLKIPFLRLLATCYVLDNNKIKAANYFKELIALSPKNLRFKIQYFLFLTSPFLYKKLLFLKRKLF